MNIYDVNGNSVGEWFDIEGSERDTYFDIEGNEYSKRPVGDLVVMSFNVLRWNGSYALRAQQRVNDVFSAITAEFDGHSPDMVGFQEYKNTALELGGGATIAVEDFLAEDYGLVNIEHSAVYSDATGIFLATASKYALDDAECVQYLTNARDLYQKMYIEFGGKRIAVFNTHLNWGSGADDTEKRFKQAKKLFEAVANEEYFIIMGDLNTAHCRSTESDTYIHIMKQFIDAGYNAANCNEVWGFNNTCNPDGQIDGDPAGTWYAHDNIITSSNITINKVYIDDTKLGFKDTYPSIGFAVIDHLPIVAHLTVYE